MLPNRHRLLYNGGMGNKVVRWAVTFICGGFLTCGALYQRRVWLQGGQPQPEFVSSFGMYAGMTTAFAALALAFMFWVAWRQSRIPVPQATIVNMLLTWGALILIALNCCYRGLGEGAMRWDELLVNLDAIVSVVAAVGVVMAMGLTRETDGAVRETA